jgi:glycosidase
MSRSLERDKKIRSVANVVYQIFVSAWGDLGRVAARLDHVLAVGADAVYLTPIFDAPSPHKYDSRDYETVDAGFGGAAAFDALVAAARARSLGLILDGVFNHVGADHVWARHHPEWLSGSDWRGFPSLRELDTANPAVRAACCAVIDAWTRRGATGWRLDTANDLGPAFAGELANAARLAGADDGTIGEVMAYAAGFVGPGGLDGVMNYWLRAVAIALASAAAPAAQLQAALDRLAAEMDPSHLLRSWSLVGSHDMPRLATVLDGDAARITQALALAFAYPGTPMLYYGDEIGMFGGADPDNRRDMIWDESRWDRARLARVQSLCSLRKVEPALQRGRYVPLPQPGLDVLAFARVTERPGDTLIFVANAQPRAVNATLFLPLPWLFDALPLVDLLEPTMPPRHMISGTLTLTLPSHAALLLKPLDDHPGGYRFFKRVLDFPP